MSSDLHALPPAPERICSQALIASVPAFPARGSLGERLRQHRTSSLERIRAFHAGGGAGLSTARLVTAAADTTLGALWDVLAPAHKLQGAVLVGVGGTGRREMSPGSDWDLLLLHTGRGEVASFARAFTTALWDVRVHLGWSVRTLAEAGAAPADGTPQAVRAGLLEVDAADLTGGLLEECFGPVTVLVRYRDEADAEAVLARMGGNLTATLHAEPGESGAAAWLARLSRFAGRVIFGGWPTGVAVAPAMTHGGPYPATTSPTTSVGGTAIDRWLRPVTYQTVPPELLPAELAHPER